MKSIIITIGIIFAAHNAFAVGYCSTRPSFNCMTDADCADGICITQAGGAGSSCINDQQCMDGFYCKRLSGDRGVCTPYPDCSDGCPDCESTTWATHQTGYEKRTTATCNTIMCVCNKKTEYRCAVGYYGTTTNGTSGCTKCPSLNGISGTSNAGTTVITSCNIPAGSVGTDTTGTFTYTANCYYSN